MNKRQQILDIVKQYPMVSYSGRWASYYAEKRVKKSIFNIGGKTMKWYGCQMKYADMMRANMKLKKLGVQLVQNKTRRRSGVVIVTSTLVINLKVS